MSLLLLGGAAGTRSHMAQQPIGGTGVVVIIAVVELVWNAVGIKDVPFRSAERLVLVPLLSTAIVALPALRFDVEMFWTGAPQAMSVRTLHMDIGRQRHVASCS